MASKTAREALEWLEQIAFAPAIAAILDENIAAKGVTEKRINSKIQTIRTALAKAEAFDKLVEARKKATRGEWIIPEDIKDYAGPLGMVMDKNEIFIAEFWDENEADHKFIILAANLTEPYAGDEGWPLN